MHLLQGLSYEYDVVVINVNSHRLSLEIKEVLALLLNQDMLIVSFVAPPPHPSSHLMNINSRRQEYSDITTTEEEQFSSIKEDHNVDVTEVDD